MSTNRIFSTSAFWRRCHYFLASVTWLLRDVRTPSTCSRGKINCVFPETNFMRFEKDGFKLVCRCFEVLFEFWKGADFMLLREKVVTRWSKNVRILTELSLSLVQCVFCWVISNITQAIRVWRKQFLILTLTMRSSRQNPVHKNSVLYWMHSSSSFRLVISLRSKRLLKAYQNSQVSSLAVLFSLT